MLETPLVTASEDETRLLALLQDGLAAVRGVTVYGPPVSADRAPTVVFTVEGHTPTEVDSHLARRRIAVWHGDNYACELVDALGLRAAGGLVRAGVARYTSDDDVAALVDALAELTASAR
jgi:selenocysteine lyase/cysteine desulfurase